MIPENELASDGDGVRSVESHGAEGEDGVDGNGGSELQQTKKDAESDNHPDPPDGNLIRCHLGEEPAIRETATTEVKDVVS